MNIVKQLLLVVSFFIFSSTTFAQTQARMIRSHGYDNCIELKNKWARVVIDPNLGGRVLVFERNGKNVLYIDTTMNGVINIKKSPQIQPTAGRFDIGAEAIQKKRTILWSGQYSYKIVSKNTVSLSSQLDTASGFKINRVFTLSDDSPHLSCKQTVKNISKVTKIACHWGRTFALGGGISLTPQNKLSRFPKGYCIYRMPGKLIDYIPAAEPNVRERDGVLEIIGKPSNSKFVMDPSEGWMAYLSTNDLLFIKKYTIYPQKIYSEVTAASASVWYNENTMVEIEPIGPQEILKPNASFSFVEDWYLQEYVFPQDRKADIKQIKNIINACK